MSKIITLDKVKNEKQIDNFLKRYPEALPLKDLSIYDIFEHDEAEALKQQYQDFYKEIEIEKLIEKNKDENGFCDAPIK